MKQIGSFFKLKCLARQQKFLLATFLSTFFCNKKGTENDKEKKTQMEKDFELIKHDGLFYEYLEMG